MEINANMNVGGLNGMSPAKPSAKPANKAAAEPAFAGATALEGALTSVPDTRSDAVARARELINDPGYPSADTVKKLSDFLADQLTSANE